MLKGDLQTTPLTTALRDLAAEQATGCLHVIDMGGEEALVFLKAGLIYSVQVPGKRPSLGSRLVSSNALTPEALSEALDAQRNDLQGWRLGELLVHLGFIDQPVVEAFVIEQVRDSMSELIRWQAGRWRFRKAEKTREDVAPSTDLEELLAEVERRQREWDELAGVVHGPGAVVLLSTRGGADPSIVLDADAWALLCKVDNERTIAELARECGFTLFEAGQVVYTLARACLVDIEEEFGTETTPVAAAAPTDLGRATRAVAAALANEPAPAADVAVEAANESYDDEDEDSTPIAARLIGALGGKLPSRDAPIETVEIAGAEAAAATIPDNSSYADFDAIARMVSSATSAPSDAYNPSTPLLPDDLPASTLLSRQPDTSVPHESSGEYDASIARVSAALSDVLGPQQSYDPFDVPSRPPRKKASSDEPAKPKLSPEETARRERLRAAAAAELSAAHAIAEAQKRGEDVDEAAAMAQHVAPVVDLDSVRRESERRSAEEAARAADEEARRAEAAETRRLADEAAQAAEEDARRAEEAQAAAAQAAEAERIAAEEDAWRQHDLWLYAERLGAEDTAWDDHVEWLAAAAIAAEGPAWDDHAAWLAAESAAVEADAWDEHGVWLAAVRDAAEADAWDEHEAWLVEARDAAEADAWDEHAAWLIEARDAAEADAWDEHAAWLIEARDAAEADAWDEHATWLIEARDAAETEAWDAHAMWLAERRAADEADAWDEHRVRIAAELEVAETEAWAEYAVRSAAEIAARRQAEEEARRVELEARRRADEEARVAAEQEAARVAAEEEAARLAAEQEEAARAAAEADAARLAAEQEEAARAAAEEEAMRLAAEAEATRLAAEAEATRLAAEAEAARLAAEQEAASLAAAEEEAARVAAEQEEATRIAAEEEAVRAAAEQEEATRIAAEEAARAAAEAARLAAELEEARAAEEQSALEEIAAQFAAQQPVATTPPVWENQPAAASYDDQFTPTYDDANADLANRLVEFAASAVATDPGESAGAEETHALSSFNEIDTAVLLRELSSLGDEEPSAPRAAPNRPPAPRPTPAADKDKKRKGLFGR